MSSRSSSEWQFDSAPGSDWGSEALRAAAGLAPSQAGKAQIVADLAIPRPWGYDEAAFVCELQAGSEAAFDMLVTHYHGAVYSVLYRMLGDAADAADVSQEVFLKAFRGIRRFRGSSSLKTWLYRIAVREALNHRRWSWRHLRQQFSIDASGMDGRGATSRNSDAPARRAAMQIEDPGASPYDSMATRELQEIVHRALRQVPEVFRGAVILRDLEGLSYEEVAEVLEVSVGTVKSRILRGRAALRDVLEPLWSATHPSQQFPASQSAAALQALPALGAWNADTVQGGGE